MLSATSAYKNVVGNLDRSLSNVTRLPEVKRETDYYLSKITNVKSVDDFMADKRLVRYALTAFGMSEMNFATAFVRRLLEGGIDDNLALANRLADQRYRDFVTTFNFKRYGATTTAFDRTQKGTADLFARQTLERSTGEVNEGARLALYFRRKAPGLTSPIGILADAALLKVVQSATGLSPSMSNLSIDAQAEMITKKIDIADFKDTAKLDKFLSRFTAQWDLSNPVGSASPTLGPLSFSSAAIGTDVLTAIQRLKLKF